MLFAIVVANKQVVAEIQNPVKWETSINKISDTEAELIFVANIEDKWHMYAQDFPDGGPIPLVFKFTESENYELVGKVLESPKPHEYIDDIFEITVKEFEKKATFTQKIKILTEDVFTIEVSVNGQACIEMCVMLNEDFQISINGDGETKVEEVLPVADENTTSDTKEKKKLSSEERQSLWIFFWAAFGGGLIAIFTPCVLPMVPMTVTFFLKGSENKTKGKFQAIFYGISIVVIFAVVGTLIAAVFGPSFAQWLSTHWVPNIFFFIIFLVFAAAFFGMFELTLPNWMISKSDKQADKGGLFGPFFMAFTLVLVSFSCTAPIVGMILVEAARGGMIYPIVGMLGFGLAFALPFTLFALFPRLLNGLPKSGGWLNSVKVVLGFIELALGFKFLSVIDQTYHWGILDREIYIAIWIVIAILMGLYLLGKIKFAHDSDVSYISFPRLLLVVATFSFVVYLIPGMFGAPLKALSGWVPPQHSHDFDLNKIIRDEVKSAKFKGSDDETTCEVSKYSDYLHLPHGLEGYFDYEQGIACAKELNKPVFIDFTGHGCVNCRKMEEEVWAIPQVLKVLEEDYLIITLYTDDKTTLPEEDWLAAEKSSDGKVKKTLGDKNGDLQIRTYNSNSQPQYVVINPFTEEQLVDTTCAYNSDMDPFLKLLKDGVEEFDKQTQK